MLVVYVDDMIIIEDDEEKIAQLKTKLSKKLKVKNLKQVRYFLRIEVACGAEGIVPS
jgi:Reverse transcriptase (RNA-dependent DNA polymerase)